SGTRAELGAGRAGWAGAAGRAGMAGWASRPAPPALSYQQSPIASRPVGEQGPEEKARAIALLDRAIAAKGGLDKLRGIKSIVAKQTQASRRPDGETQVETTNYIQYPDRFRVEAPDLVQGYDGVRAWMRDRNGVHDAPESLARDAAASLRRDVVALLLAAKDGALATRLLPDIKDPEGLGSHALELSATELNPIVLYIDPESSMIRKRLFAVNAPGNPLVEEQFSDYRDVDGVQFAFHATQKVGPLSVERTVTDVKINPPLDPALFKRPAS